jgi:hypothetical protein
VLSESTATCPISSFYPEVAYLKTRDKLLYALASEGFEAVVDGTDTAWTVTVPILGARILGAGTGEENALWTSPSMLSRKWNAGGERSWIAPEIGPGGFFTSPGGNSWNVPKDLDPGAYRSYVLPDGGLGWKNEFEAISADGRRYHLALHRSSRIIPGQSTYDGVSSLNVRLDRALENMGEEPLSGQVGMWEIVQVPNAKGGIVLIPVGRESKPEAVRPYYYELPDHVLGFGPGLATLRTRSGKAYKIGVLKEASTGSITALRRTGIGSDQFMLVALHFDIEPGAVYLDKPSWDGPAGSSNGDPVQAYNSPGRGDNAFAEIEAHAPAAFLPPGGSQKTSFGLTIAEGTEGAMEEFIFMTQGFRCKPGMLLPL